MARKQEAVVEETAQEFNGIVNTMTNYQRSKWGKAGYPGLRQKDVEALTGYMKREGILNDRDQDQD